MKHSSSGSKKQGMCAPDLRRTLAGTSSQAMGLVKFSLDGLFAAAISFLPVSFHESREFSRKIGRHFC